jgi:hypothetical protein
MCAGSARLAHSDADKAHVLFWLRAQSLREHVVPLGPIAMDSRLRIGADYDSEEEEPLAAAAGADAAAPSPPPPAKRSHKRKPSGEGEGRRKAAPPRADRPPKPRRPAGKSSYTYYPDGEEASLHGSPSPL